MANELKTVIVDGVELTIVDEQARSSINRIDGDISGLRSDIQNIPSITVDSELSDSSSNPVSNRAIKAAIDQKQDTLTFDVAPVQNSTNAISSGSVYEAIQNVSVDLEYDSVPTANSQKLVKSGGIYTALQGVTVTTDSQVTQGSTNPVQSGAVYTALQSVTITTDATPTQGSTNPVQSGGVYSAIQAAAITVDSTVTQNSSNPVSSSGIYTALQSVQVTTDATPTQGSTNPVQSGGVYSALQNVSVDVDSALSTTSRNAVENRVINSALTTLSNRVTDLEEASAAIDPSTIETAATIDKSSAEIVFTQNISNTEVIQSVDAETMFDTFGVRNLRYEDSQLSLVDSDGVQIGDAVTITGGGGGGTVAASVVRITNRMDSRTLSIMDSAESLTILYNVTSIDTDTEDATGPLVCSWYVSNMKVASQTVEQGNNSFNIRPYLTNGTTNTVKMIAEDSYGVTKSMTWYVTVNSYSITWNVQDIAIYGNSALTLRITPNGTGAKTLKVTLDGVSIYNNEVSTSGRAITVTVPAQTHGAHTIEAWIEVTIDNETLSTDKVTHVGIWTADGTTTPIIAVLNSTISASQYSTTGIRWMVYDPTSEYATVDRLVNGDLETTVIVDQAVQYWPYKVISENDVTLTLRCRNVTKNITIDVVPSSIVIRPVTENLVLDLDPTGHSNSEANRTSFGYRDIDGVNHPLTYSQGFDWSNGGFKIDEDGVTAFVVKKGSRITFDTSLFANNAATTGKEIKVIFKPDNVMNYDAVFARCVSDGIGLTMGAQTAKLQSELSELNVYYCEGEKIEMDINIHQSSATAFSTIWLEGKPSCAKEYTIADNWKQSTPANLVIGSDECDIWIYRIKMYDNDLTRFEIMDNFIADCADPIEMVDRYTRNNIFTNSGQVDRELLAAASPGLRIIHATIPRMTTSKEDSVTVNISHTLMNGGVKDNWTATGAIMKAQGTSSLEYGLSALNLDIDLGDAESWTDANGGAMTSYSMTDQSIGVKYFNLKLNVASSENANNVLLADDYNTFNPCRVQARVNNSKVRDTVEGHPCAIFLTNSSGSAITVGARSVDPGETIFYGSGDMNNSKKNNAVFGQDSSQWSEMCCIEIANNNNLQCRFKSDDLTNEDYTGKNNSNFEFRYPKNPTAAMKNLHQQVLSWVVSTDRDAATNSALPMPVTVNGNRYTVDTAAYRADKFKAQVEDYFSLKSLLFHYLFTERHLMVDNRAKNTFMSYEYDPDYSGYRWNFCKDYDNDTAEGNDNSGGLTFTYGLEDTDMVGDSDVFNAADSVLWVNIRDLFAAELAQMYVTLEAQGAWSSERILQKYTDYQGARPEALVAEDMYNKYVLPYTNAAETRYLKMLLGDKDDQRRQFETYQEAYIASKYSGSLATSDAISLRANTAQTSSSVPPSGDMVITPYSDLYVCVRYGNAGTVKVRAKRGVPVEIVCPANSLNDTETYIQSSSWLSEVGDLSALYSKLAELASAKKLLKLELGNGTVGYYNTGMTSLSFGNNTMLKYVDIQGLTNLTAALDLSALLSLEELYASGSGITGIILPTGAPINTVYLPAVRSLTAKNLANVEQFVMPTANITSLWVENCPGIDTAYIVNHSTTIARGRLTDVDWVVDNLDGIMRLIGKSGYTAAGGDTDHFVLTGTVRVREALQEELNLVRNSFPELTVTCDTIVPPFVVTFYDYDGVTALYAENVRSGNDAIDPVAAGIIDEPTRAPTVDTIYTYTGWSGSLRNITANTSVTATFSETDRTYRVRFWNGSVLVQNSTVIARDSVSYEGDILTNSDDETAIWMGFSLLPDSDHPGDLSALNSVVQDLEVYAAYAVPTLPSQKATDYTYLYTDNPEHTSAYSFGEFIGIIQTATTANNRVAEYFSIGDKIEIIPDEEYLSDTSIILQIEAFNHFRVEDGTSMSPVVFGMLGVLSSARSMNSTASNVGGYPAMTMRSYLNGDVYNSLPRHWKSVIEPVQVRSSSGRGRDIIVTSTDKVFLRSAVEIGLADDDPRLITDPSVPTETPYTKEVDSAADQRRFPVYTDATSLPKTVRNNTGTSSVYYWTRSPYANDDNTTSFVTYKNSNTQVDTAAYNIITAANSGYQVYISFCFCIGKGRAS